MEITIPLPPVTKKNSGKIIKAKGRYMVIPSDAYRKYEKEALGLLPKPSEAISSPVNVKALFYMPTHRRVDLVNLLEAVCDTLVKAGILADDNSGIVVSHDGSRVLYDKEKPRTEVFIDLTIKEAK